MGSDCLVRAGSVLGQYNQWLDIGQSVELSIMEQLLQEFCFYFIRSLLHPATGWAPPVKQMDAVSASQTAPKQAWWYPQGFRASFRDSHTSLSGRKAAEARTRATSASQKQQRHAINFRWKPGTHHWLFLNTKDEGLSLTIGSVAVQIPQYQKPSAIMRNCLLWFIHTKLSTE